jgi:Protein of unknown function (DUF4089)
MSDPVFLDYVKASAALQGLALDHERAQAVAAHLARTARLAQLLNDVPLPVDDELAEIYCPASFLLSSNITK